MLTSTSTIAGLVSQAAALTDQQAELSRELGTGTRLTQLSNDPLAAAATVRLSSAVAQASASIAAIQTAQARMQAADAALGSVVAQMTTAVSVAVAAANDTDNSAGRVAAASQLSSIRASLLGLANSSFNGSYLFGGTANGSAPFHQDPATGDVTYLGDAGSTKLGVQGATVQTSVSGTAAFGPGGGAVFSSLQSIINILQSEDTPTTDQVTSLRSALQIVIDGRSALGSSESRLADAGSYTATQKTNLQVQQTTVAATDPVALATELSRSQTQRSALLSSLALLGKSSLFDYLS